MRVREELLGIGESQSGGCQSHLRSPSSLLQKRLREYHVPIRRTVRDLNVLSLKGNKKYCQIC